jgi:HJR/Mrr/RecB family endonuclease
LKKLEENILREIDNICIYNICRVLGNMFRRNEACLEAGGQKFETLILNKVV